MPNPDVTTYQNPVWPGYFADPFALKAADGAYYAYGTGPAGPDGRPFPILKSTNLVQWESLGGSLEPLPSDVPMNYWAPEVAEHNGRYYLYYSASPTTSDEHHRIRVAVADHPAGPFTDVGEPLHCGPSTSDIDPAVFRDPAGGGWYCYWGSGGDIVVQELAGDLRSFAAGSRPRRLLRGWSAEPKLPFEHGIEGPYLVERDGWYHLWYSGDRTWTYPPNYATMAARSRAPDGPFERRADGSSHVVLHDNDRWRGPGHNSVLTVGAEQYLVYHSYDAVQGGTPTLRISALRWNSAGWPVPTGP